MNTKKKIKFELHKLGDKIVKSQELSEKALNMLIDFENNDELTQEELSKICLQCGTEISLLWIEIATDIISIKKLIAFRDWEKKQNDNTQEEISKNIN